MLPNFCRADFPNKIREIGVSLYFSLSLSLSDGLLLRRPARAHHPRREVDRLRPVHLRRRERPRAGSGIGIPGGQLGQAGAGDGAAADAVPVADDDSDADAGGGSTNRMNNFLGGGLLPH